MTQDTSTLGRWWLTVCDHKWVPYTFQAQDKGKIQVGCPLYKTLSVKCMECGEEREWAKREVTGELET